MYDELIKNLRICSRCDFGQDCNGCTQKSDDAFCCDKLLHQAADAIEQLSADLERAKDWAGFWQEEAGEVLKKLQTTVAKIPRWIPVTERLPECDLGAEVGNIEWISCGIVHAGCFGRGGKYRDAYFRTWTDAGEGMDAKDADYWRAVTLPAPPKEES